LAGTYENNMKITSEGLMAIYKKKLHYQNFPLYYVAAASV